MNGRLIRSRARVVVLLPALGGHGGIQRYNRTFCKALQAHADARSLDLDIVSLHDPPRSPDLDYLSKPVHGCAGDKRCFLWKALACLAKPLDLLILGHVDFSPLALLEHLSLRRTPILTMTHGIEVWRPLPLVKRAGLCASDRVLAVSAYTASALQDMQGVAPGKTRVIPNVLADDFIERRGSLCISGGPRAAGRLLSVTRMNVADRDKGIDTVIDALAEVRHHVPDVTYVVAGDGDDRPRLEQLATERGVGDIVRFVGSVSDDELHRYLATSDVFVLPSRKEGFGIVFLEAMAYGTPVVAGAHGGSPEVVVDGETGYLVEHGDRGGLATVLVDLLRNEDMRTGMGQAGLERVRTIFSFKRYWAELGQVLDELIPRNL